MSITTSTHHQNPLLASAVVLAVVAAATAGGIAWERSGDSPSPAAPVSVHTTNSGHFEPTTIGGRVMLDP